MTPYSPPTIPGRGIFSQALNAQNAGVFAALFRRLLVGRTYTHVMAYEYKGWEPEAYRGETAQSVKTIVSGDDVSLLIDGTSWSWGPASYLGAPVIRVDLDRDEIRYGWTTPEGKGAWTVILAGQQGGAVQS